MELSKEQTLTLLINNLKVSAINNRFKFTTKTRWNCLRCQTEIFVSYKQYGRNSIFCEECYPKVQNTPTVAQYQYMRVLKERQLKMLENQLEREKDVDRKIDKIKNKKSR